MRKKKANINFLQSRLFNPLDNKISSEILETLNDITMASNKVLNHRLGWISVLYHSDDKEPSDWSASYNVQSYCKSLR